LNCDYCYFFNAGDDSYKGHSAFISNDTVALLVQRLRQFSREYKLQRIAIHLHGGEPLLIPKAQFDGICEEIRSNLAPVVDLSMTIQTNGMLIDLEWIEIFNRHGLQVGVSLDGAQAHNDAHRLDHHGRSSYDATVRGLALCQEHLHQPPTILAVIGEEFDPGKIYGHFRNDLNTEHLDFLLPHQNHDNFCGDAEAYGEFLIKVFDMMVNDEESVSVRFIDHFLARIYGQGNFLFGNGREGSEYLLITVSSDGGVGPDDTLRSTKYWSGYEYRDLKSSSLEEIIQDPLFHEFEHFKKTPASACSDCCWRDVCGSGQPVHRYASSNGFDNPSVYCQGLDKFYTHVLRYLALHGEPLEKVGADLI
ncbi:MAG: radical SAM protein, partial [Gammaproteobacteria bacterium]|nr:radical SAM protein [Gammaproteobacteria bacterium]